MPVRENNPWVRAELRYAKRQAKRDAILAAKEIVWEKHAARRRAAGERKTERAKRWFATHIVYAGPAPRPGSRLTMGVLADRGFEPPEFESWEAAAARRAKEYRAAWEDAWERFRLHVDERRAIGL